MGDTRIFSEKKRRTRGLLTVWLVIQAVSFGLSACGGGGGSAAASSNSNSYTVGGMVSGLSGTGLVLQNNTADDLAISNDGSFTFTIPLTDGSPYSVTVKTQPAGRICTASNNAGTIAGADVTAVNVSCVAKPPSFVDFQTASIVIGQPTFTSNGTNQDGSAGPKTVYQPGGKPAIINGALYLPDSQNNRLLGFNSVPTVNDPNADFVLGQPSLTSSSFSTTATTMHVPLGIMSANGKLFAADADNNRVLIWNAVPTTTQTPADLVIGQTGFLTAVSSCTQTGLNFPTGIAIAGNKLIVADGSNNRVLIWNSIPASSGAPADLVLGQEDFTHCQYNDDNQDATADATPTGRTFYYPSGIWTDGTRLIVVDNGNSRVLIWNSIPTASFTPADRVLGQNDLLHGVPNDDSQTGSSGALPTARTLSWPSSVDSDGTRLIVSDSGNNRVLIWNSIPSSNFTPADVVIGQGDFTHQNINDDMQTGTDKSFPTARTLNSPDGVYISGTKLFVGDKNNNRFLIFEEQ